VRERNELLHWLPLGFVALTPFPKVPPKDDAEAEDNLMRLIPDNIRSNHNFRTIMELRVERFALKHVAEHRVRLGEEHLLGLRQELLEADRNFQEVKEAVATLRESIFQHAAVVDKPYSHDHFPRHVSLNNSDNSSDSSKAASDYNSET